MYSLVVLVLVLSLSHSVEEVGTARNGAAKPLKPIVLVPGFNSNRLEGKLDREEVPYEFCQRKSDRYLAEC